MTLRISAMTPALMFQPSVASEDLKKIKKGDSVFTGVIDI